MILAELQSSCSLQPYAGYTSRGVVSFQLWPELPDRNAIIKDSPKGKIGIYTRFIEFTNYRVPLSKFLLYVLEYYQINLSWLSVIGAAKVSHFEIMCRTLGRIPTVGSASVDEAVDLPCVELLNKNCTLIRKYLEPFLYFVGLCCSFTKTDFRPTLLHDNDEEMGLLDFVKSDDPFKVKVGEQTLGKNEVPLIIETEDRGEQATAGSGSAAAATEDVTSSSVTLTLECALEDAPRDNVVPLVSSSQDGTSVPVAESTGDGHPLSAPELETRTLSVTPSQGFSADDFYESQSIDSATTLNVYVPTWSVTNNARVDNPITCQNILDHVTPPGYWAMLCNQHDARFLDSFNINSPQHVCMVSELHLRYEHEIMTRDKYEKRFIDSVAMVQERDAEVAELKAKLEKSESKAEEVEELCMRVSDLESTVAVKVGEAASLTAQNAGLFEKVSALELERDGLKVQVVGESKMQEEFVSYQDAAERRFVKHAAELDARIADV
ncbi:hypothetical protein Tco_0626005 [Tanacetum coccineum]|uniref:Transposase (Putative), gypsy type n=1 Tax=Tanacetum coccineum TaxID=301880 RepID=A0ABQ4WIJ2_9ASTR